jgi:hypothetical protein
MCGCGVAGRAGAARARGGGGGAGDGHGHAAAAGDHFNLNHEQDISFSAVTTCALHVLSRIGQNTDPSGPMTVPQMACAITSG